jgi:16S rRNA (cytidine1402-2'-O)-methyltransferase
VVEGRLFVCATPIGNLGDVSDRLRKVLAEVDLIFAEDTRRAAKLLSRLAIEVEMRSLFVGNELERTGELLAALAAGRQVALLSDAGMPVISDPGARAIALAHERGYQVSVVPGPSSVTAALALSGFPADRFVFEGFLPRKGAGRRERLAAIAMDDRTTVIFSTPKRLREDLQAMCDVMGKERRIVVTREMTKLHEEVWAGSIGEALSRWVGEIRGEVTLVVAPGTEAAPDLDDAVEMARALVASGLPLSEAAKTAAGATGVSRRDIYQTLIGDH